MKQFHLTSTHYLTLESSFRTYLEILGYAPDTLRLWPVHCREFFFFLEGQGIGAIGGVQGVHVTDFIHHLKTRPHQRKEGLALSASSINNTLSALAVFSRYLRQSGRLAGEWLLPREPAASLPPPVLTTHQVRQLYESTFLPSRNNPIALGQRDRAIIAVLYGCGLRRNEALHLACSDIDLDRRLILVRAGKGSKERYVPIAQQHAADIDRYLAEGRTWFLQRHTSDYHQVKNGRPYELKPGATAEDAFFLSERGQRLRNFYQRIEVMAARACLDVPLTPHSLRHAIATHLLERGMDIEDIARFLGHSSLASTQIYTHLLHTTTHA
ncbi:tyrosine-type recombinase/integrase [Dinghuibacter silviterrae]|uniref:Integrase/recombinase XerD n=1 Tax=Dinghuibacter silviterrae TaxID=1539049 RepID=A0A4R8DCC2_9BACT|nr:tyrosine-type recombinase/integrase [Dinghuibacter silviterrae]TDW91900.1 integrase/recombinase XerD [Dinghuibacter silviterrae]